MEVKRLNDKLNALTSNLIEIRESVNVKLDGLNGNLKSLQAYLGELEKKISDRRQAGKQLENRVEELKTLLEDLRRQLTELEENVKTVNENLNNLKTRVSDEKTSLKTLDKILEELKQEENRLTEESERLMKNVEEAVSEINSMRKRSEDEKTRVKQSLEEMERRIGELKRREAVIDYLAFEASSTPVEAFILAALILRGEASIKELQESVPQPPSIVSRILHSLEEKGLITIIGENVKLNREI